MASEILGSRMVVTLNGSNRSGTVYVHCVASRKRRVVRRGLSLSEPASAAVFRLDTLKPIDVVARPCR
jgi:hypothetical protein